MTTGNAACVCVHVHMHVCVCVFFGGGGGGINMHSPSTARISLSNNKREFLSTGSRVEDEKHLREQVYAFSNAIPKISASSSPDEDNDSASLVVIISQKLSSELSDSSSSSNSLSFSENVTFFPSTLVFGTADRDGLSGEPSVGRKSGFPSVADMAWQIISFF